ncbi:zinc ribbon domain-containing protein [Nocardioides gilvus]|uniref:zinc ribbon domain-containing protein n=1 Tax=Nocardioides gilvus TaxID=1735589 RepID=UPI001EF50176|nr:C4-type zinc ribbon domain-containing protein [Nocardioides gilvus]
MDNAGHGLNIEVRAVDEEPALKADPNAQLKLLDVQQIDSRLAQLRHRRGTLAQLREIASLEAERALVRDRVRDAQIEVHDLTAEQTKAEADVEQVRARRTRDRKRMDEGQITNPKDLTRMTHELESLERRVSKLEDDELEIMERLETAQASLGRAEEELNAIDQRVADLEAERDAQWTEIDAEAAQVQSSREAASEGIPADLLALYERLRVSKDGLGAALLRARECGGCRLTLDHLELAAVKAAPADEVIRCEECSRIMVRTNESGLGL